MNPEHYHPIESELNNAPGPEEEGLAAEQSRLSETEALAVQAKATHLEGLSFSEQAKPESYEEAEALLKEMQAQGFDSLGIDWNNMDVSDDETRQSIEAKLDVAAREMIDKSPQRSALGKWLKQMRRTVLPLSLSAAILMSEGRDAFAASRTEEEATTNRTEQTDEDSEVSVSRRAGRFLGEAYHWKNTHPAIQSVRLNVAVGTVPATTKGLGGMNIQSENTVGKALLEFTYKDGTSDYVVGEAALDDAYDSPLLAEASELLERGIEKVSRHRPNLPKRIKSDLSDFSAEEMAVRNAFVEADQRVLKHDAGK